MSFTPPQSLDLTYVINLLEENAECCAINNKYLIAINDRLNRYDLIFRELLKCCERRPIGGNTGVILPGGTVIPGQIVNPPAQVNPNPLPIKNVKPIRDIPYESYDTPFIPNGSIIDIPGTYFIDGDRYIDKSGTDLRRYLPYDLSIKKGDTILEGILDYRIIKSNDIWGTMDVILVYQTKNLKTGVRTTYEAGRNHYRSWYKIHDSGEKVVMKDVSMYQRGRII